MSETGRIFKETMAKNVPNFPKDTNLQFQKAEQNPKRSRLIKIAEYEDMELTSLT